VIRAPAVDDGHVTIPLRVPRASLTVVAAPPEWISQLTAEQTIGVPRRAYLDLAREYATAGGAVLAVGKLRLTERTPLLAWLRSRSAGTATALAAASNDAATDDYAASLGLVPVAAARRSA